MSGEDVRAIRISRNMTQTEFAAYLRVSRSTIGIVESGHRPVSDNLRIRIAQTFGCGEDVIEAIARAKNSAKLALYA